MLLLSASYCISREAAPRLDGLTFCIHQARVAIYIRLFLTDLTYESLKLLLRLRDSF